MAASALSSDYCGHTLCLASQHRKEQALSRPFKAGLGLNLVVSETLDTDAFGSFSGEHPRREDALRTCLRKAEAGLALSGERLGLASEGSFGPHPGLSFLAVGIECLTFIDSQTSLVVQESLISARTNFSQLQLQPGDAIDAWLQQVGFPDHGLLVRQGRTTDQGAAPLQAKGIRTPEILEATIRAAAARSVDGWVQLETDMRAHMNPTRMAAIRRVGFQLVRRLRTRCGACGAPGWGLVDQKPGLPCAWCGLPTRRIAEVIHGCAACDHQLVLPRHDGLVAADPGHCDHCNP